MADSPFRSEHVLGLSTLTFPGNIKAKLEFYKIKVSIRLGFGGSGYMLPKNRCTVREVFLAECKDFEFGNVTGYLLRDRKEAEEVLAGVLVFDNKMELLFSFDPSAELVYLGGEWQVGTLGKNGQIESAAQADEPFWQVDPVLIIPPSELVALASQVNTQLDSKKEAVSSEEYFVFKGFWRGAWAWICDMTSGTPNSDKVTVSRLPSEVTYNGQTLRLDHGSSGGYSVTVNGENWLVSSSSQDFGGNRIISFYDPNSSDRTSYVAIWTPLNTDAPLKIGKQVR